VNMNIPAPEIGALQVDPKTQSWHFLENSSYEFDWISVVYGDHLPKYEGKSISRLKWI
jgi:hypothetical protein